MLSTLGSRLSYANVMATLGVFIALGGTSYAITQLPKNSVGARQLKINAVTKAKIRKNAITTSKVKDASLLAKDFKAGELPAGAKGDPGVPGRDGTTGTTGTPGAPGTARAYGLVSHDGTLRAQRSRGVQSVLLTAGSTPVFCITLDESIDSSQTSAIVTPDSADSQTTARDFAYVQSTPDIRCPDGSDLQVVTSSTTQAFVPKGFFFVVP
jgi:hypothetical protein